jgi:hypothetical protein
MHNYEREFLSVFDVRGKQHRLVNRKKINKNG